MPEAIMAKEVTISGLVPQKEVDDLKNLVVEFDKAKNAYASLAQKLSEGIKTKPGSLEELKLKADDATKVLRELAETQNKLSKVQSDCQKLTLQLNEATKQRVATVLEEAKAADVNASAKLKESKARDMNAAALLKEQKAESDKLKQQKLLNQEAQKQKVTMEEVNAIIGKQSTSITEAEQQNRRLRLAVKQLTEEEDKDGKIRQKLNSYINQNTEYIRRNSDAMIKQKMTIGDYREQVKAAIIELKSGNSAFKNIGIVAKGFGGILKENVSSGLSEVRMGVSSMIKGMVGAQAIIGALQKLIGFFKSGVQSIIDFEAANSKLAAVLGTNSKNIKDLTADAQRLGAATKYTASEATNLQIELAKLGFSRKEILQATEGVLKFAQATGAGLPEAAALAGASIRMFAADTKETERYVSAMAVATTKSALSFSYLQTAMPIVGPVAKAFNFSIEDTLALLGKLSDSGFDASMAATALRNIFLNLADSNGKLAKSLGGPVSTLPELVNGMKKLKDQGVDLATTFELTDKRSVAQFNTLMRGVDSILPLREQITGVTGELNDMADEMTNNVQGSILGLSSAWEAFMLSFSESKGPMKDVLDFFAKGLREVARQLRSYSQLQDDADNAATARAQKEMASSDIIQKNRDNMTRLYKEKLNEGMNSDEAAIAAKEEYIQSLKSQFEYENAEYQIAIQKRVKAEEELDKVGFFYFNSSKGKSKSQLKENVETLTIAAAGKKAIASITESVIDELSKVDLKQQQITGKNTNTLTDKEKKELEKAEKEKLRLREEYIQSELDITDEGLEKEISKISLSYNKKIAAIKGNTKDEIKTRENLAIMMQNEVEEKTISHNIQKEKDAQSLKLETVKEGSQEELDIRKKILDLQMEEEINAADKTGANVFDIYNKYQKKKTDLDEKFADEKTKKIQDQYAAQSIIENQELQLQLDEIAGMYARGEISKEEFEKRKLKITQDYAIKEAQLAIEIAKMQLNTPGLSPESKLALEQKIAEAEIKLAETVRDAEIDAADKSAEAHKKKMETISQSLQMVGDVLNAFSELGSALFEKDIEKIEEQQDANEKAGEEEIERIDKMAKSGAISTEESEARKRAAEERTSQKNKELEKQKLEIKQKQAKWDKANSISQAIIGTSLAVINALQTPPFPLGLALAITAGVVGAANIATIIAQPIPKYKHGTHDHKGGFAIVGDGGRSEVITTPSGESIITPSVPTLVDIPKHSMVFPDLEKYYKSIPFKSDLGRAMYDAEINGSPVNVNVSNDYSRLESKMESLRESNDKMTKYMRKFVSSFELNQIASRL